MAEQKKLTLDVEEDEDQKVALTPRSDVGDNVDAIPFSLNVKHTIEKMQKIKTRKIMIAMDSSEFSQKAIDFVFKDLYRETDSILLISIWEEAMVNQLVSELDTEIIHPEPKAPHKAHSKFNNMFDQALCFKDHEKLTALLVESSARINTVTIGEELCNYAKQMGINILVCGTRGLGGIKKAFLGSVSEYVAKKAPCTSVIVK